MEIDEEYIDKVKSLIEQKDAENVKTLLTTFIRRILQNYAMTSAWRKPASFTASLTTKRQRMYWLKWTKTSGRIPGTSSFGDHCQTFRGLYGHGRCRRPDARTR